MRRIFLAVVLSLALSASGAGLALAQGRGGGGGGGGGSSQGCPQPQPPDPPPPGCGQFKERPAPPDRCDLGPIFTQVDAVDFGPLDETVHDVLCALEENNITL